MTSRITRLAPDDMDPEVQSENTFRFVFSNEQIGRDGHVVRNRGIQTANYLRNPVVLFGHDDSEPPIGRGSNIDTSGINCRIDVTFASRDVLPFAGTIRDLVAGKWLRGISMSWLPIEWGFADNIPGREFTKVDLLEVSIVPLPALPNALAEARSHGVDARPLRDWAEHALEMPKYHAVPRSQLEAIYRAAGKAASASRQRRADPTDAGRRARVAQVQEIIRRGERMERARRLAAGERAHYAGADRAKLKTARRHLKRATKHHEAISLRHGESHGQLEELQKIHDRATSTLSEFGERSAHSKLSRHLEALDRCIRDMRSTHEDQADSLDFIGGAICDAGECVDNVLDANQVEPAGVADK
jgi:hypothetical protein